jgi:iron(III) transport system ATP-binding protein
MTALTLEAVTVRLGEVVALQDVSLALAPGSRLAVVGASGSGKTTLLRAVVGLAGINSGTISLDGQEVCGPTAFVPAHRRAVGYVPQDGALFPHLTVRRNIGFGVASRADRPHRVKDAAGLVALEPHLLERYPHELSGGQQQRVALARALAANPRMIVLDEPFSALDTALRESARCSVMRVLDATGMTAILVTHDRDEALTFGDSVGVLDKGQLVQAGAPQALFDDPVSTGIAAFLGDTCFLPGHINGDTALTALGPVHIRHRHDGGGPRARIMLRPNQFAVSTAGVPNACVKEVTWRGATSRIHIRAISGGEDLALDLATDQTEGMRPNQEVHVQILGSGVSYSTMPDHSPIKPVECVASRLPVAAGKPS